MRGSNISTKSAVLIGCLAAMGGVACSDGGSEDAGAADMGSHDVDAGSEDIGAPEAGACACTFGYHQGCASAELCMKAYSTAPMCTRIESGGGCVMTTTTGMASPCNAQCVAAEPGVSPCAGMGIGSIQGGIGQWFMAIDNAAMTPSVEGWQHMKQEDIDAARTSSSLNPECIDFLGWTTLALIELCRGDGTVQHFEPWEQIENRLFKHLESPADDCEIGIGRACEAVLTNGVQIGEIAADAVDNWSHACDPLRFAPPCDGADARDCMKGRLRTIIRALHHP